MTDIGIRDADLGTWARQIELHVPECHDQRLYRRYQLDLDIRCKLLHSDLLVSGRVRDISSRAVCFISPEILPQGAMVELSIDWPVRLLGTSAMQLKVRGSVVRSGEQGTAVLIMAHEFRTRKTPTA